jgi:hypothetical protein
MSSGEIIIEFLKSLCGFGIVPNLSKLYAEFLQGNFVLVEPTGCCDDRILRIIR